MKKSLVLLLLLLSACGGEKHTYVPAPNPEYIRSVINKAGCDKKYMTETWFDLYQHHNFKCQFGGDNCFGWKLILHVKCRVKDVNAEFSESVSFGNSELKAPDSE